ncbi:hypothetical protein QUF80_07445 [Desulfococcaceae bacterium HSG8]|nr:hypothetical protein [Desulfococcaceae bacterium HSG8]
MEALQTLSRDGLEKYDEKMPRKMIRRCGIGRGILGKILQRPGLRL